MYPLQEEAGWWYSFSHHLCTPVGLVCTLCIPRLPIKSHGKLHFSLEAFLDYSSCRHHSGLNTFCSSSRVFCGQIQAALEPTALP